jgi:hypothetical protein
MPYREFLLEEQDRFNICGRTFVFGKKIVPTEQAFTDAATLSLDPTSTGMEPLSNISHTPVKTTAAEKRLTVSSDSVPGFSAETKQKMESTIASLQEELKRIQSHHELEKRRLGVMISEMQREKKVVDSQLRDLDKQHRELLDENLALKKENDKLRKENTAMMEQSFEAATKTQSRPPSPPRKRVEEQEPSTPIAPTSKPRSKSTTKKPKVPKKITKKKAKEEGTDIATIDHEKSDSSPPQPEVAEVPVIPNPGVPELIPSISEKIPEPEKAQGKVVEKSERKGKKPKKVAVEEKERSPTPPTKKIIEEENVEKENQIPEEELEEEIQQSLAQPKKSASKKKKKESIVEETSRAKSSKAKSKIVVAEEEEIDIERISSREVTPVKSNPPTHIVGGSDLQRRYFNNAVLEGSRVRRHVERFASPLTDVGKKKGQRYISPLRDAPRQLETPYSAPKKSTDKKYFTPRKFQKSDIEMWTPRISRALEILHKASSTQEIMDCLNQEYICEWPEACLTQVLESKPKIFEKTTFGKWSLKIESEKKRGKEKEEAVEDEKTQVDEELEEYLEDASSDMCIPQNLGSDDSKISALVDL